MIHFIIGTRAQLIKIAPVMIEIAKRSLDYSFIFTGQHNVTIDELINIFGIKQPDLNLYEGEEIMKIIQAPLWSLKCISKSVLLKDYFAKEDIVLVHGDAYSAILGAIIAKLLRVRVGHIEAGLRSFDYFNPFPEEITRVLVSKLTDYHFCPGSWAINNINKGVKIDTELNTLYDSLNSFQESNIKIEIPKNRYCIVSIHRFENIFNKVRLKFIIDILIKISKKIKLLFILHPSTENKLKKYGFIEMLMNNNSIELRPRYDYFKFIKLIVNSEFIITDGGSNQEECYYLGKPCLIFRDKTERLEGLGRNAILSELNEKLINDFVNSYEKHCYPPIKIDKTPSKIIVDFLEETLSK